MGIVNYLSGTKVEMKHVSWPTRKQSVAYTAIVIVISLLAAVYLGFFDFLFSLFIKSLV